MGKFTGHTITNDSALGSAVIERSLKFNDDDSAYLSRTPGSAGNRKTFTFSCWFKRSTLGTQSGAFLKAGDASSNYFKINIANDHKLYVLATISGGYTEYWRSAQLFRDIAGWTHLVLRWDTTQGTAADRVRVYINGTQMGTSSYSAPSQDLDGFVNDTNQHEIGASTVNSQYWDGYIAEVNFVDGYSYDASYFGFTESQTGLWMPKRYEGAYGTNGFRLDFNDNSSTAALGIDKSPNGNDFTVNNFSVAAWPDGDSVIDTPTNNFCTLNDIDRNDNVYLANGSLQTAASATGGHYPVFTTIPVKSGKWYLEWKFLTNDSGLPSIMEAAHDSNSYNTDSTVGNNTSTVNKRGYGFQTGNGNKKSESGNESYGSAMTSSDTGQCAFDADTGKIYWGKNNTWFNSGNPETGANPAFSGIDMTKEYLFTWHVYGNNNNVSVNFGSQGFTYTPPSGFKSLCTENLSLKQAPSAVTKPQRHFDTLLYTGDNSSDRNVEGLEFQPDFVWIKNRDQSDGHQLVDVVRGANKTLFTNSTTLESTDNSNGHVNYFTGGGFNVDAGAGGDVNENSEDYVAWCWKAGGAAVTNNDGSITTQVSANQEAGFSIMTYTGTGSAGTCGHGLGAVPHMIITKRRDGTDEWTIYHKDLDHSSSTNHRVIRFNASAQTGSSALYYGNDPTSTVQHQAAYGALNASSETYVAYCWTSIPGYSKIGRYTGNGSSTGQFVHLGFKPAFIMLSRYDSGNNWHIADSKRQNSYNPVTAQIYPNLTSAEVAQVDLDFVSNGFKFRNSAAFGNASGGTYIYMAFAEQPGVTPFDVVSNAR